MIVAIQVGNQVSEITVPGEVDEIDNESRFVTFLDEDGNILASFNADHVLYYK